MEIVAPARDGHIGAADMVSDGAASGCLSAPFNSAGGQAGDDLPLREYGEQ